VPCRTSVSTPRCRISGQTSPRQSLLPPPVVVGRVLRRDFGRTAGRLNHAEAAAWRRQRGGARRRRPPGAPRPTDQASIHAGWRSSHGDQHRHRSRPRHSDAGAPAEPAPEVVCVCRRAHELRAVRGHGSFRTAAGFPRWTVSPSSTCLHALPRLRSVCALPRRTVRIRVAVAPPRRCSRQSRVHGCRSTRLRPAAHGEQGRHLAASGDTSTPTTIGFHGHARRTTLAF